MPAARTALAFCGEVCTQFSQGAALAIEMVVGTPPYPQNIVAFMTCFGIPEVIVD